MTVNIALNKPTYQNRPRTPDKLSDPSNVVNGRKAWRGGEWSKTYGEQNATWLVNLTTIHRIHHVIIYYMKSYGHWGKAYILKDTVIRKRFLFLNYDYGNKKIVEKLIMHDD